MKNSVSICYTRTVSRDFPHRLIKIPKVFCEGDEYTVHPDEVLLFTLEDSTEDAITSPNHKGEKG